MTHPAFQTSTVYFSQRSHIATLRFSDERDWKVVYENWQGSRLCNTGIEKSGFASKAEADAYAQKLNQN